MKRPATRRLALALSTLGHPFVLLPLTVLLVSLRTAPREKALALAGALTTVTLVTVNVWVAGAVLLLATAVGWARVWLERHTLWQVLSGAALGAACGLMVLRPALL